MSTTTIPARRRGLIAMGVTVLLAAPLVSAVQLSTDATSARAATSEVEAPDYATRAWADPWDYTNSADQNTNQARVRAMSIHDGALNMRVGGGDYFTPVSSIGGSLANGRDGAATPINTSKYDHLSFSMNQPSSGVGAVWWWHCTTKLETCGGGQTFKLYKGTHTYVLDLNANSTVAQKKAWKAGTVTQLRIAPTISGSKTNPVLAKVDWLRLYEKTGNYSQLPAGKYSDVTVTSRPSAVVDTPNSTQGEDIATAQGRFRWVFTSSANARGVGIKNATVKSYNSQGMTATNAGPHRNDPEVLLPVKAFSGSQYRYLSFTLSYNGPFSLSGSPGGGKLARLVWTAKGSSVYQESNDIVTYSGVNSRSIDIDLAKGSVLDENARTPKLGWAGRTITSLRFDPNEDPGANTWHLKAVHIRKAPTAKGAKTVAWHDAHYIAGTKATVTVGTSASGTGTQHTIASNVAVTSGVNHTKFSLGQLSPASYFVTVTLVHPNGSTSTSTSNAPVTMSR